MAIFVKELIDSSDVRERCWCGAKTTVGLLLDSELEELLDVLEGDDEIPTWTELNDFFWFETDWIAQYLGYKDYEDFWEVRTRYEK